MSEPEIDLAEVLSWCRARPQCSVSPGDLQRHYAISYSRACALLEAAERDGDLARVPGPLPLYRPTAGPGAPGNGYALPLSAKEHGALLRLLDEYLKRAEWAFQTPEYGDVEITNTRDDAMILRQVRARLKRPA